MDSREVFLAHHGILGQKWGRKNDPLDASDHSASENKAGWRKSLAGGKAAVAKITKSAVTKHKERVEAKKRQQEELKKQQEEAEREKIIKSGDPNEILANREKFSDDELRRARERVRVMNDLKDLERQNSEQVARDILSKGQLVKEAVDLGVGTYKSFKDLKGVTKTEPDTASQQLAKKVLSDFGKEKITNENREEVMRRLNDDVNMINLLRDVDQFASNPNDKKRNSTDIFSNKDKGNKKEKENKENKQVNVDKEKEKETETKQDVKKSESSKSDTTNGDSSESKQKETTVDNKPEDSWKNTDTYVFNLMQKNKAGQTSPDRDDIGEMLLFYNGNKNTSCPINRLFISNNTCHHIKTSR